MKRVLKIALLWVPAGLIFFSLVTVLAMKWIPPAGTPLMLVQSMENSRHRQYEWVPLEKISKSMVRAVITSEDQKFLTHNGFDIDEIKKMKEKHDSKGSPIRGCSTISQQTAKNCFTWCTRTYLRKGVEAWYTLLIERIWGKRRIMEVYLNIAQMGPGIYGAEAAAQYYYHKPASKLSVSEAATLACCLPNPDKRNPSWVSRRYTSRRNDIIRQMNFVSLRDLGIE